MTDHASALESALIPPKTEPPSFIKRATQAIAPTPPIMTTTSAVEEIAMKILHLEYIDMMEWMGEVHSQIEAIFYAKQMHDWALHKLEKKTSV
jgi:hypothetical protein